MTFAFAASIKTIKVLEEKYNAVKYDDPQCAILKLAYVTALEKEFADLHKVCSEGREAWTKCTAREVLDSLKKNKENL